MNVVKVYLSSGKSLIIMGTYRPPNRDIKHCVIPSPRLMKTTQTQSYAVDLNLPDIDWTIELVSGYRYPLAINQCTLNMSAECGFTQLVGFPTCNENTFDYFFMNRPSIVWYCIGASGISDHDIVLTSFNSQVMSQKEMEHKCYFWAKANLEEMRMKVYDYGNNFVMSNNADTPVE